MIGPAERSEDRLTPIARSAAQPARDRLDGSPAAPSPRFLGIKAARALPARRPRRMDRLDSVLPDLGAARATTPPFSTIRNRVAAARSLFTDANVLLDRIVKERLLEARAVFGFLPRGRIGDDIEVCSENGQGSYHGYSDPQAADEPAARPAQPRTRRLRRTAR